MQFEKDRTLVTRSNDKGWDGELIYLYLPHVVE